VMPDRKRLVKRPPVLSARSVDRPRRDGEACGIDGRDSRFLLSLAQLGGPSDMVLQDNVDRTIR